MTWFISRPSSAAKSDAEQLDEWMGRRGPQRALPHPRQGRPADFLFVEHGKRPYPSRLRRGLALAVEHTGLVGPNHKPLRACRSKP